MSEPDPTRYRATWFCRCDADYAVGFGATIEEARKAVRSRWWQGGHLLREVNLEIIEEARVYDAQGSSRYVEVSTAQEVKRNDF